MLGYYLILREEAFERSFHVQYRVWRAFTNFLLMADFNVTRPKLRKETSN